MFWYYWALIKHIIYSIDIGAKNSKEEWKEFLKGIELVYVIKYFIYSIDWIWDINDWFLFIEDTW